MFGFTQAGYNKTFRSDA